MLSQPAIVILSIFLMLCLVFCVAIISEAAIEIAKIKSSDVPHDD